MPSGTSTSRRKTSGTSRATTTSAQFLDTAKELGLYATVRVGPYVCAEWDSGGYPVWLKFKPPMKVRTADPE